jgi:subtilisin family serine protease
LIQAGTTVVAAMGNENSGNLSYPAAIPGVIAVGASSINDTRASFSNFGSHITLVAPGVGIWSTLPTYAGNTGYRARPTAPPQPDFTRPLPRDIDYASWDGTSMASPHVAAAVALLLAKTPLLTPAAVKQKLQAAAVKVPAMQGQNFTSEYGYGRLDLVKLLS